MGREAKLAALVALLGEAPGGGRPRVVLCEGEPGIGKTRLAEELLRRATARGAAAPWGSGLDSEGAPPYWPWRQALPAVAVASGVNLGGVPAPRVIVVTVLIVLVVKAIP